MIDNSRSLVALLLLVFVISCSTQNTISNATPVATKPTTAPLTPLPIATFTMTEVPTVSARAATRLAEQTLSASFSTLCTDPHAPREFSPNGSWMTELCHSEEDDSLIMTLSNKETQRLWKLVYRYYKQRAGTLFDEGFRVVNWSSDDRYAYISVFFSGDGGECFTVMSQEQHGEGLLRLDLQTGSVTTVLPVRDLGYDFSFAPTGRRLVYDTYSPGLKVLDLQTGELIDAGSLMQLESAGNYIWSPDGLQFVYSKAEYTDQWEVVSYSLRLVDGKTGKEQIVLESAQDCIAVKNWKDDHIIVIESFNLDDRVTVIEYDLNLNQALNENTATPAP